MSGFENRTRKAMRKRAANIHWKDIESYYDTLGQYYDDFGKGYYYNGEHRWNYNYKCYEEDGILWVLRQDDSLTNPQNGAYGDWYVDVFDTYGMVLIDSYGPYHTQGEAKDAAERGYSVVTASKVSRKRKAMRKRAYETDKKTFVEGVLTKCLRETREQIDYCAYYQNGGEEYVAIVFDNGQSIDANVTASSNLAMLYDVYKALTQ